MAFNNYPEIFGITKQEGQEIRSHFQNYSSGRPSEPVKNHWKDIDAFVLQNFPGYIV